MVPLLQRQVDAQRLQVEALRRTLALMVTTATTAQADRNAWMNFGGDCQKDREALLQSQGDSWWMRGAICVSCAAVAGGATALGAAAGK